MWCALKDDTVALRISSAPTTQPDMPFVRLSMPFTREPQVLVINKDIDRDVARVLCEEMQLTTEQLAELPPVFCSCDVETLEPTSFPAESAELSLHSSSKQNRTRKRSRKRKES